jgi:fibronectin-binding autotransporter adhesin
VINLSPGTSLTMNGGAFGWYGNNNAGGLTVNVDGAICQPSGAFGIGYNLKGGTLGTGTSRLDMGRSGGFNSFINSKASSTTSVVNPAGGEVLFRNDSGQTVFTFDTEAGTTLNGIDLDIQKPLNQTSGSSIVKTGPGTMKLSAVNNYSGGTTINGGKLALTGRVSGGPFTMNDNTALSVAAAGGTSAVSTTGTMTVGSDPVTPAGTNTLEFAGLSSISVAPISVGYVYLDNPVTINIASVTPLVGQYPLIKFSNAGGASVVGLTLGTLPAGITATLVDDTAGASQSIYLDVTDVVVPTSIWAGTVNGTWDIATTGNWSGASALYSDGNIAEFDDSASPVNTNITLNTTVNPAEVAFYNDTLNYTISGSGTIAGFTQLFKTAGGTLTLNNNNTYTGKTTVTGGILELGGSLATSEIANSAALVYNLSSPQTVSYALTGGGSLTKTGAATLTLQGNKNFGGGVIVNQGTLHINAGGWYTNPFGQTNTVTVNSGGTLSTAYAHSLGVDQNTIVINGGTLALGAENYISNLQMTGGTVSGGELRTWGGTMTFNASSTGAVISSPFSLVGGATLSVDDGSVADDLTISGVIFNGNGITKTGAGTLRLTGVNTYTGATNLNQGTLAINGTSIADATNLVINGGIVAVTGTETVNALFFGSAQQASGTWGATGSGAAHIDDTRFSGTGVVSVTTAPDFSAWAVANAPGQTVSQDHDNDGITNGIEYFMGLSGSAFTANPGVVAGKVSWPKGAAYIGAYGVDYVVQTSPDLSTWTDILVGDPNLSNGSPLEYTLPAATKVFTRLKVTGP